MKCKIYLSDEGFGHLVRQEAIIKQLDLIQKIDITIQTKEKIKFAREKFKEKAKYIEKHNGIQTTKTASGKLNVVKTINTFKKYISELDDIIAEEIEEVKKNNYDFIISDSVPHAHYVAHKCNIPSFGVFHFDWAWFCRNSIFVNDSIINRIEQLYESSTMLYTPPFCPKSIIKRYKNIKEVSFVINSFDKIDIEDTPRKKVLIMDNGTSNLSQVIIANLDNISMLDKYIFYIDSKLVKQEADNIKKVDGLKKIHSLIPHVDLVIARAGFNTLTESLITKTPGLFVSESMNAEIRHNINCITDKDLCGTISPDNFMNNFLDCFSKFMKVDYERISKNLKKSNYNSNGAKEIAKDIIRIVNGE